MGKRKEEKRQIFWPKQVARPTADQFVQWDYPLFALTSKSSDFSHNNERQFGGQKRGGHIVEQIGREKRGFLQWSFESSKPRLGLEESDE